MSAASESVVPDATVSCAARFRGCVPVSATVPLPVSASVEAVPTMSPMSTVLPAAIATSSPVCGGRSAALPATCQFAAAFQADDSAPVHVYASLVWTMSPPPASGLPVMGK